MEEIIYKNNKYFLNDKLRKMVPHKSGVKDINYEDIQVCGNCCEIKHKDECYNDFDDYNCNKCYEKTSTLESAQDL